MEKMKYFKQNYASGSHDRTVYGSYVPSDDIKAAIAATVYSVNCDYGKYYYEFCVNYFEPDEITEITEEEYRHVVEQLQKVGEIQAQIDAVMKALI